MFDVVDPDVEPAPGKWRRIVVLSVIGGVLAIALAIVGTVWFLHDLHRTPPLIHKYELRLDACVRGGGSHAGCERAVYAQCRLDAHWRTDERAKQGCRRWEASS